MTDAFFDTLLSMKESMGTSHWVCEKCQHATKKLHKEVIVVAKRLDKVETDVIANKSSTDNNKLELDQLKARMLKLESANVAQSDGTKTAILAELKEIEDRKTNAVISGLDESDANDPELRKRRDLDLVEEIASIMNLEVGRWLKTIVSSRRLGKLEPNKSRPLLVSFNDPEARNALMSNARYLFRSAMDHVSIKPDLTKKNNNKKIRR